MIHRQAHARPAGQLGREGKVEPHQLPAEDHGGGAEPRAPSVYEEFVGVGRQPFPIHSVCFSSSTTRRACEGRALHPRGSLEANTGELFASGIRSRTPCSAGLPTLVQACSITYGRAIFTTCPSSGEQKEKEDRTY